MVHTPLPRSWRRFEQVRGVSWTALWWGPATSRRMERAIETKRRRSGCAQRANPILSIAATVAPQSCDLVRGACSVSALARPVFICFSLARPVSRPPTQALAPISCSFVLFQLRQFVFRPKSTTNAGNGLNGRYWYHVLMDPPVKCRTVDPENFGRL